MYIPQLHGARLLFRSIAAMYIKSKSLFQARFPPFVFLIKGMHTYTHSYSSAIDEREEQQTAVYLM